MIITGLAGSRLPCSRAPNSCSCVTVWKPWPASQRIWAAKSAGATVSARVIAGSVGRSTSIRWYIRIGTESVRAGSVAGRLSRLIVGAGTWLFGGAGDAVIVSWTW